MKLLKIKRIEKNLSMEDVAKALGCNKQQIYNFESGAALMPIKYVKKASKVLDIKYDLLLNEILEQKTLRTLERAGLR